MTADEPAEGLGPANSEQRRLNILAVARAAHDQRHRCDPKYVMSCRVMTEEILKLGKRP